MFDNHQIGQKSTGRSLDKKQLLEEIAWFEARLEAIGGNGDCAYEKALARSYEQAVAHHRECLSVMQCVNNQQGTCLIRVRSASAQDIS